MSTAAGHNIRSREPAQWRTWISAAASDWAASHGGVALFLIKTVIAALLAALIAMEFDLSQPRTALATVFVLMQPVNGMVLAKSVYRIIGTLVGASVAVALAAMFGQAPECYLVALSLWIAICTGAAARHRGFRWYGMVLAGYTAALIGAPNVMHPELVFDASLTRTAEVVLGVICSGLASALIFPRQASTALRVTIRDRHLAFVRFAANALASRVTASEFESVQLAMIEQAVDFEASRLPAAIEEPELRARQGRLARMNIELMRASTRLHALFRLLERAGENGHIGARRALKPFLAEVARELDGYLIRRAATSETNLHGAEVQRADSQSAELQSTDTQRADARALAVSSAADLANALTRLRESLPLRVRRARAALGRTNDSERDELLDFDTATELLYRLLGELTEYALTYAALIPRRHPRERSSSRYVFHTHWRMVLASGLRSGGVVLATGAFWMATAWPSGGLAVIAAAVASTLCMSAPHPARLAWQLSLGSVLAGITSYLFVTRVYPAIDGFPLLACALSIPFGAAALLASRPRLSGYGIGLGVFFCILGGPDNVIQYHPDVLINDSIAVFAAVTLSALAFGVVFPPRGRWLASRMSADLRSQIAIASHGWPRGLEERFHSGTRDLTQQLSRMLADDPVARHAMVGWSLSVLEIGHSVIHLRKDLQALCESDTRVAPALQSAIEVLLEQLIRLFNHPGREEADAVCIYADATIATLHSALDGVLHDRATRHRARNVLSELHFIRTALLDADAPWRANPAIDGDRSASHAIA